MRREEVERHAKRPTPLAIEYSVEKTGGITSLGALLCLRHMVTSV